MSQTRIFSALFAAYLLGTAVTFMVSGCQQSSSSTVSQLEEKDVTADVSAADATSDSAESAVTESKASASTKEADKAADDSSSEKKDVVTEQKEADAKSETKPETTTEKAAPETKAEEPAAVAPAATLTSKSESAEKKDASAETAKADSDKKEPAKANAAESEAKSESKGAGSSGLSAVDKKANPKIVPGDWNQWGGSSYRNNVPVAKAPIPTEWVIGDIDRKTGEWSRDGSENIRWVSRLGSQTYGNPVVADGRVYVGSNNTSGYLKRYPSDVDLGVLLCFRESDGKFLWQHSSEKLPSGRVNDWPLQGICCAPYVEGTRLWFVTSRGEVKCLDTEGFHDGEDDGPLTNQLGRLFDVVQNEDAEKDKLAGIVAALKEGKISPELAGRFEEAGAKLPENVEVKGDEGGKKWTFTAKVDDADRQFQLTLVGASPSQRLSGWKIISPADKDEADEIWSLDMMAKLQVHQHNMCSCSITALGDLLFVNTSNGVDESHVRLPQVEAPSFICLDKNTGEIYWTDSSPGQNILHGQWSSPAVAELGGVPQVIFGGGDGWLYSFKADKGKDGKPELLWEFDCNPKETKYSVDARSTRNHIIATPVIYDGLVYVAVGEDPEHGEGDGHLWCIDPTKRGDVSAQLAVSVDDRTKKLPKRRLQAIFPDQGEIAIDNPNSAAVWHFAKYDRDGDGKFSFEETMHRTCGTVVIKNDLLFVADFSGLFHCLDAKTGKLNWTYDMLGASWGSPLIVNDKVYVGDEDGDIAIFNLSAEPQEEPLAEISMENAVYTTPIVANDTLFIANKTHLFAIATQGDEKTDKAAE